MVRHCITVIGLGSGNLDQLPLGVYRQLKEADLVYLRTKEHPVVQELVNEGLTYESFDSIYEENESFDAVYEQIVTALIEKAKEGNIIYAVPGHPLVAERTVKMLLERKGELQCEVVIAGGQSFLDSMFAALEIDPVEGFQFLDGNDLVPAQLQLQQHMIISQVYDAFVASEVKLSLMERLPDDYEVMIVTAAGNEDEEIKRVPLYQLDHETNLSNLTSVYVPPVKDEEILYQDFEKLRDVIATLRGPNGCPWDRKQTHESLKKYLVEETYEVLDAIEKQDDNLIVEELGDVLLQVMLHAQIGEDDGYFSVDDVIRSITEKMVRRHPHVFGNVDAETAEEVVANWEEIKKQEKTGQEELSLLDGIPLELPSLYRAYELQKKAAKVGFDWKDSVPMWEKVKEELDEFRQEIDKDNKVNSEREFGDIIFALVNIARYYKIDPEEGLRATNLKFYNRFRFIEQTVQQRGQEMASLTLDELDQIWEEAKKNSL